MIYLIVRVFRKDRKNTVNFESGYLFGFKTLFTSQVVTKFSDSMLDFSRFLGFPLYVSYFTSLKKDNLRRLLAFIAVFVGVSTIPFHLKLIDPLVQGYGLERFGEDQFGFVGIFQQAHYASVVLAMSSLVLLNEILTYKFTRANKRYMYILLVITLYSLYQTYVRTGYIFFIIGTFSLIYFKRGLVRSVLLTGIMLLPVLLYLWFGNSEVLQNRLTDQTVYANVEHGTGSGRPLIYYSALLIFYNYTILDKIIGVGTATFVQLMEVQMGESIFAHDGYINALVVFGVLGFIFFVYFIFSILSRIRKNRKSIYYPFAMSVFLAYQSFIFVQGGSFFLFDVLIYGAFALAINPDEEPEPNEENAVEGAESYQIESA